MGEFRILINDVEGGLIHGEVVVNAKPHPFTVGHKHAPIDDLLRTLLDLHETMASGASTGAEGLFFSFWEGEPSQYTWRFTPLDDALVKVEFSFCENVAAGIHTKDEWEVFETVTLRVLLEGFHMELRKLLVQWGLAGYRQRMLNREFPLSDLIALGALLGHHARPHAFEEELTALKGLLTEAVVRSSEQQVVS